MHTFERWATPAVRVFRSQSERCFRPEIGANLWQPSGLPFDFYATRVLWTQIALRFSTSETRLLGSYRLARMNNPADTMCSWQRLLSSRNNYIFNRLWASSQLRFFDPLPCTNVRVNWTICEMSVFPMITQYIISKIAISCTSMYVRSTSRPQSMYDSLFWTVLIL